MDILGIIATLVQSVIPSEYMPVVVAILTILFALEQYLAGTQRFKANSTLQAIGNILKTLKGKLTAMMIMMMFAVIIIVSGCAGTKASWEKLTPDDQSRVVVSGMQKQLNTLFDKGLDFVILNPQYEDRWTKDVLPAFDKANKALRVLEETAIIGNMTPEKALERAVPLIQAVNNLLISIGAIGGK